MTEPTVPGENPPEDRLTFPEHLPISAKVAEIARALHEHQVVVVAGATGSGKTTQLPKIALGMGRGLEKRIGLTQPRRIAATSVAARIADAAARANAGINSRCPPEESPWPPGNCTE